MRNPSPFSSRRTFQPDGSNLPWVIYDLEENHPTRLRKWIDHIQTALPDLTNIRTVEMPENRSRYLKLEYKSGLEAPSWMISDGTLRLLALTILAYIPDLTGIYLIEEPENGIHPQNVQTVFQSLTSLYDAQVLLATHSPVVLSIARQEQLLCFARIGSETAIVRGDQHPRLQHWKRDISLSTLFADGVLA
jgi:predicted ATPase